MKDILQEFENLKFKRSKIYIFIMLLYVTISLIVIPFIIIQINSIVEKGQFVDNGIFILGLAGILLIVTFYLIIKITKSGWLLLTLVSGLLWGFFAKIIFFYVASKWQIISILNTSLAAFIFLATTMLLSVLYLSKTRKHFNIDISFLTISLFLNILIIFITLFSFS